MQFGGIGLVLLLVAGLTTMLLWPKPNKAPFDQAVANLAAEPAIRYSLSVPGPSLEGDVTVTNQGDAMGTFTQAGQQFHMLAVGDKVYVKAPEGLLPEVDTSLPASVLKDKWVTGTFGLPDSIGEQYLSPAVVASSLRIALDQTTDFPSTNERDISIDGTAAVKAVTPAGDLYVTKNAPYQVLRYVPSGLGTPGSVPARPDFPAAPSLPDPDDPALTLGDSGGVPLDSLFPGLGEIDFDPLSSTDINELYDTLEEAVGELADAVDIDIRINEQGKNLVCGPGGCTLAVTIATILTGGGASSGQLTARMGATFSIEGIPAGGCVNTAVLPFSGGTISCSAPGAGPAFAAVEARKKAAAQAEANAKAAIQRGRLVTVPYEILSTVQYWIYATPQVDIEREREQLQKRRAETYCSSTPNSFVPGTKVLLADGSARPIENITLGTAVLATDPVTGQTTSEPVLAKITGHGQKQLNEIIISDGQHTGTITATINHPFWDLDQRNWVHAGDLRSGERLVSSTGIPVRVSAVQPDRRSLTVYNLTVANIHTYYVLAGETPVLVHNIGCDEWADAFIVANGGKKLKFTPPAGGRVFPEGSYAHQPPGEAWFHHTVVVRDGKVFDQWNPNGISIPGYRALWGDMADEISFGF